MYIHERESETILNMIGEVGGFTEAIAILISPFIFYYAAKQFDMSLSSGAPITLRSITEPSGRNARLQKRINSITKKQQSRIQEKLERNQNFTLEKYDVVNLLMPLK